MKLWQRLELEWKIFLFGCAVFLAFGYPMQRVFVNRISSVLTQSIDPDLERLLRSRLDQTTDPEEKRALVASLERNRQWQALIPTIVREQRQSILAFGGILLLSLAVVSAWTLKRMTRPLRELAEAVDMIGKGRKPTITVSTGGALGVLQNTVDNLQTELDELRERIRMQGMEKAWQDIARVMAHEIKNPLTPIRLTLDRLEEKAALGEEVPAASLGKALTRINAQTDVLERLVNQFRSFSREPEVRTGKVAVHRSIDAVATDMSQALDTSISGEATIAADPYLLSQVFLNVWKNALEAGATKIDVQIEPNERDVRIRIRDNGPGIAPEDIDRIWLPYVSFKKSGTGLGLPVVKKMVETMNGSVALRSSQDTADHGAIVILTFRRKDQGDTAA